MTLTEQMSQLARQAKAAAHELARLTTDEKNVSLHSMAEALEQDIRDLKLSRENYFYSLLDARYRELIAREARQGGPKGAGRKR